MIKDCDLKIIHQMKGERKKDAHRNQEMDEKAKHITDKQEEMITMYYEAKAFNHYYDSTRK